MRHQGRIAGHPVQHAAGRGGGRGRGGGGCRRCRGRRIGALEEGGVRGGQGRGRSDAVEQDHRAAGKVDLEPLRRRMSIGHQGLQRSRAARRPEIEDVTRRIEIGDLHLLGGRIDDVDIAGSPAGQQLGTARCEEHLGGAGPLQDIVAPMADEIRRRRRRQGGQGGGGRRRGRRRTTAEAGWQGGQRTGRHTDVAGAQRRQGDPIEEHRGPIRQVDLDAGRHRLAGGQDRRHRGEAGIAADIDLVQARIEIGHHRALGVAVEHIDVVAAVTGEAVAAAIGEEGGVRRSGHQSRIPGHPVKEAARGRGRGGHSRSPK